MAVNILEIGKNAVAYTWLVRPRRFLKEWFAYPYVASWLLALIVCFSTSRWWADYQEGYRWLIVLVPAYRLLEILRWWLSLIFNRRHYMVLSSERNLIFLALNLLETVFVGAILFRATGVASSLSGCWYASFFLVTQLNLPGAATFWQQASKALIEIASLTLLLGGLSALIALVGGKLREGEWRGPTERADS
jgi:hypothetical protein